MTAPAAISGTFADLKTIKSRSVVQLIIEVPIEHGASVVEAFGFPQPGAEVPVAVARLVAKPEPEPEPERERKAKEPAEKKSWSELSRAQRAGIACNDARFRQFLIEDTKGHAHTRLDAEQAAAFVRARCDVRSRSDLDRDEVGSRLWDRLYSRFLLWRDYPDEYSRTASGPSKADAQASGVRSPPNLRRAPDADNAEVR